MEAISEFKLDLRGEEVIVTSHKIKKTAIYRVSFSSRKKPIVITMGENNKGELFWTSIPEGRQKEAEEIGKLIENHSNS